jgi:hypothetical protein
MLNYRTIGSLALCFALMKLGPAYAQQQQALPQASCAQGFYDPAFYNWFSYRNTCPQDLYVAWISNAPGLNGGGNIAVGKKISTGWSASEIKAKGGLAVYICPKNYLPVDSNGNSLTHQVLHYSCKFQGN